MQCPFTCATKYFSEWEFHRINNIGKALAPYKPFSVKINKATATGRKKKTQYH
jgi:hypothetical protein